MPAFRDEYREKRHRLPRRCYCGNVSVSYHACVAERRRVFASAPIVDELVRQLTDAATRHGCKVRAYCFMPDHLHVILRGQTAEADTWAAMFGFKRRSGVWLSKALGVAWQKGFYDEILSSGKEADAMVGYVLANPVRKGIVEDWWDYQFNGPKDEERGRWMLREG
jgi:putative transposase